jgi:hypothetical protein
MPEWAFGLPLHSRAGVIRKFAIVDEIDYERLREHRWHVTNSRWGLVGRCVRGQLVYLHRAVLGLAPGDPRRVDHINRNPLDNRRANLRTATTAQNAQNQDSRGGSSRYRGVTWDKSRQKWMATAMLDGRRTTIGRFDDEDEAGCAAAEWRAKNMPYSQEAAA